MKTISVIVPIHNTKNYVRECLESILDQSYSGLEILCIDSSTDETTAIIRELSRRDPRIRHILDANNSYGYKLNRGIREAGGEYIGIVDSDDYIERDMYLRLLETAEETKADFVKSDYSPFYTENGKNVVFRHEDTLALFGRYGRIISCGEAPELLYRCGVCIWTGLYRTDFLRENNIVANETPGASFQDTGFSVLSYLHAKRIMHIRESYYRYRTDNAASSVKSAKKVDTVIDEFHWIEKEAAERGIASEKLLYALTLRKLDTYYWNYDRLDAETRAQFARMVKGELKRELLDTPLLGSLPEDERMRFEALYFAGQSGENKVDVSVIIPVYNKAPYLPTCLDSLLAQTLENIEIVCVDDGSTDGSKELLRSYAARDARVQLIELWQNSGTLHARLTGTLTSQGQYVMFCDPDDWMEAEACQIACESICARGVDVLQFTAGTEYLSSGEQEKVWLEDQLRAREGTLTKTEYQTALFLDRSISTALFGKIYDGVKCRAACRMMPDLYSVIGEDVFQQFFISCCTDSFCAISTEPLYRYRCGHGITWQKTLSMQGYEMYCRMAILYEEALRFSRENKADKFTLDCVWALGVRMCENCARAWKDLVPEEDKSAAFTMFYRYWARFAETDDALARVTMRRASDLRDAWLHIPEYVRPAARWGKEGKRKPKVSVIIPVYNVEQYLAECLDSVIGQSLKDIEIICVNDGSLDNSLNILEEYAKMDERITLISQKHRGLSEARNAGLAYATGEYIEFLDSDDWIVPGTLETMYTRAKEQRLDVLFFGGTPFCESERLREQCESDRAYFNSEVDYEPTRGYALLQMLKKNRAYNVQVCMQTLRADFLRENNLRFYPEIYHEDELFTFQVILLAERAAKITGNYYVRRVREGSIMTSVTSIRHMYGCLKAYAQMTAFAETLALDAETERAVREVLELLRRVLNARREQLSKSELQKLPPLTYLEELLYTRTVYPLRQVPKELPQRPADANKILSDKLLNRVRRFEQVYIYGAGFYAKAVYAEMLEQEIPIAGFVVTSSEGNPKVLKGHRVYEASIFSEMQDKENCIVVIAVKADKQKIQNLLEQFCVQSIYYSEGKE